MVAIVITPTLTPELFAGVTWMSCCGTLIVLTLNRA